VETIPSHKGSDTSTNACGNELTQQEGYKGWISRIVLSFSDLSAFIGFPLPSFHIGYYFNVLV